jgi:alpha-galactosidase/6-phospho-beta-glucosidase family protein
MSTEEKAKKEAKKPQEQKQVAEEQKQFPGQEALSTLIEAIEKGSKMGVFNNMEVKGINASVGELYNLLSQEK